MALTLSSGGVASHASAAALYGLVEPPSQHDVTVTRATRSSSTALAHSSTSLTSTDIASVDGIPATSPARTLIDAAGTLPNEQFEDVLDLAIVTHIVTPARLRTRAAELWAPRRRGCAVVLELLDQRDPDLVKARNIWEARVLRMVRAAGLPRPECNFRVHVGGRDRYLDLAWPSEKVAAEFDGFVPHSTTRGSSTTTASARTTSSTTTGSCSGSRRPRSKPTQAALSIRSPAPSVKGCEMERWRYKSLPISGDPAADAWRAPMPAPAEERLGAAASCVRPGGPPRAPAQATPER